MFSKTQIGCATGVNAFMFIETQFNLRGTKVIKTQEFCGIVAETYSTIRNVYGRPGREPRMPGPDGEVDFAAGRHRRYVFADALAWRFARSLSGHSLDWDTAADIIEREGIADVILNAESIVKGEFFAVWPCKAEGKTQWAAWRGLPCDIAAMVEHDSRDCEIESVLMVSCDKVMKEATDLAFAAGYAVVDGDLVPLKD